MDAGPVRGVQVGPLLGERFGLGLRQPGQRITISDLAAVVIAAAALPDAANRVFSVYNGEAPAAPGWQSQFAKMPAR